MHLEIEKGFFAKFPPWNARIEKDETIYFFWFLNLQCSNTIIYIDFYILYLFFFQVGFVENLPKVIKEFKENRNLLVWSIMHLST